MDFLNTEEKRERRLVHLPMGRFGEAVELGRAALFCAYPRFPSVSVCKLLMIGLCKNSVASEDSSYVTVCIFNPPFYVPFLIPCYAFLILKGHGLRCRRWTFFRIRHSHRKTCTFTSSKLSMIIFFYLRKKKKRKKKNSGRMREPSFFDFSNAERLFVWIGFWKQSAK